ncbi:hypothetical protein NM208_g8461 [Fusarium decemcellulare]|uniref:Uncharacterized protein n=1 Tax=Fusarium decemcellulare TaxID=57161 RepID=A0ACC1S5D0_9HYPO|nr:hypothetical protein NM208_g8461 [Fusarium decemcellulare]
MTTKSVLITGCSTGGLGFALAEEFHHAGFHVFATARDVSKVGPLRDRPSVDILPLDVTSPDSISSCIAQVRKKTGGKLDILVNNAGGAIFGPLVHADINEATALYDVNVWGVLRVTQAFAPLLKNGHGAILNISSMAGAVPLAWQGDSKAALTFLSETLRLELEPLGIRVVTAMVGAINTQIYAESDVDLPVDSWYKPIEDIIRKQAQGVMQLPNNEKVEVTARSIVRDTLKGRRGKIWRGGEAGQVDETETLTIVSGDSVDSVHAQEKKSRCQSFESLEERLANIETHIASLTSRLSCKDAVTSTSVAAGLDYGSPSNYNTGMMLDQGSRDALGELDGETIHHDTHSMRVLCEKYRDNLEETLPSLDLEIRSSTVYQLLQRLRLNAAIDSPPRHTAENASIGLPLRHDLDYSMAELFSDGNYATDIFLRPMFQTQVDRLYSEAPGVSDEPWIVCFNAAVALYGKIKLTASTAASSASNIFLILERLSIGVTPFAGLRLVNVQALAMLSVVAELCAPAEMAENLFSQACLYATRLGLHQIQHGPVSYRSDELCERQMVFQSLYIRDKHLAMARGTRVWLPKADGEIHGSKIGGCRYEARMELAKIQDEIYHQTQRLAHQGIITMPTTQVTPRLVRELDYWAMRYGINKQTVRSLDSACLLLSYFATHHYISLGADLPFPQQSFHNTDMACIVFLEAMAAQLGIRNIIDKNRWAYLRGNEIVTDVQLNVQKDTGGIGFIPCLLESMPLSAIFTIAARATAPEGLLYNSTPDQDYRKLMLEALRRQFSGARIDTPWDTLGQRVSRVIDALLEIIHQAHHASNIKRQDLILSCFTDSFEGIGQNQAVHPMPDQDLLATDATILSYGMPYPALQIDQTGSIRNKELSLLGFDL